VNNWPKYEFESYRSVIIGNLLQHFIYFVVILFASYKKLFRPKVACGNQLNSTSRTCSIMGQFYKFYKFYFSVRNTLIFSLLCYMNWQLTSWKERHTKFWKYLHRDSKSGQFFVASVYVTSQPKQTTLVCLGAVLLPFLVFKLQKPSSLVLDPRTFFGVLVFVSVVWWPK
jgi:hypothetical protein